MSLIDSTVDLETGRPIETTAKIRLCRSFTVKVADMDGAGKRMERHEVIFLGPFTFSFAGNSSTICLQAKSHRFISEATPEGLVEQTSRPNHVTKIVSRISASLRFTRQSFYCIDRAGLLDGWFTRKIQ